MALLADHPEEQKQYSLFRDATLSLMRHSWYCALLCILTLAVFLPGLNWGLPSHSADPYLFGNQPVWPGQKILALGGGWESDAQRGADVAKNPLAGRDRAQVLNATDIRRAQIIRRYRLYSNQPDEMITFRALASMDPRRLRFDPKIYQYGGLWVYPVGAMLKLADKIHFITIRSDLAWYLDHPEDFGRFYVVARFYTVFWAMVGVAAVYTVVRRICGGTLVPAAAAICFSLIPVVVTAAHEAKPHLPGAVLILLAVLAAASYVETGRRVHWAGAGALCGAAVGMVLWAYPVFLILPVMTLLRPEPWRRRVRVALTAGMVGVGVYLVTNPYVPINLFGDRAVLRSNFSNNLANSSVMYHVTAPGLPFADAARLFGAGASPALAIAGILGAIALGARAWRRRGSTEPLEIRRRATGLLLAVPSLALAVPFVVYANGKAGEYGRFAIVPDIFLVIESVVGIGTFLGRGRPVAAAFLVACTIPFGFSYVRGFVRDSGSMTSRLAVAGQLEAIRESGGHRLAVFAEPAPYCQPPVDLFRWQLLLMPRGSTIPEAQNAADAFVRPIDPKRVWQGMTTPLSWADKRFELRSIESSSN